MGDKSSVVNTEDFMHIRRIDIPRICKVVQSWNCFRCYQEIPKGSYCLCGEFKRICLHCTKKEISIIRSFAEGVFKEIETLENSLKNNLSRYERYNTVAFLKSKTHS